MQTLTVDDGITLSYRLDGPDDAPLLVLSTSLGTDLRMWDTQVALLRQHVRILRYDTRGHGESDVPQGPTTIARLGQDILALLDHLDVAQATLCGLSLGGLTALWVAARHAERVERLIVASTAARIGSAESWNARILAVRAGGMPAIRDTVLARFLSSSFQAANPAMTRTIVDMLLATSPAGYRSICAALRDADLRPIVSTIRAPTLIIASELDESTPPAQSEELGAAIPGSTLVVLPQAVHLSNIEQPELFTNQLLTFLGLPPAPDHTEAAPL